MRPTRLALPTSLALSLSLTLLPTLAAADALLISTTRYAGEAPLPGRTSLVEAATRLEQAGLPVTQSLDQSAEAQRSALAAFANTPATTSAKTPTVILLTGRFVHGAGGTYLLAGDQGAASVGEALTEALPLNAALTLLAQTPGAAVLLLGEAETDPLGLLASGAGPIDLPQGVTLIRGGAQEIAQFAARALPLKDLDLVQAAQALELEVAGFLPAAFRLDLPNGLAPQTAPQAAPTPPPVVVIEPEPDPEADARAWAAAQSGDSADSYAAYLDAFPDGANAAAARQRLAAIAAEPFYAERRAEEALSLSRDARRAVQSDLKILGFYSRGIDGLLGRGSRAAISAWQSDAGLPPSGYLTEAQILRLSAEARRRAQEIEAAAAAERAERDRQDRAFWQEMDRQDTPSLQAYLDRFPDGVFADRARDRLAAIAAREAELDARRDREAWEAAQADDSVPAYERYLRGFPQGDFAREARARITALTRPAPAPEPDPAELAAQAEERALGLNAGARRLAEARLEQLGLPTGAVDGRFDNKTRGAIQAYQQSRGLRATGYLDQATVVRLMAEAILRP